MMREIVLDTETTGLNPTDGHRIVEIGGVELLNHMPTGRSYHQYINPERGIPEEAQAVHGLTEAFLRDKPRFGEIAGDFLEFLGDARLVIHNAAFDMGFLNAELTKSGFPKIPEARAFDTLTLARKKYPGAPASLDALCRRFGVDNSAREKHGALLDSEILAEVYLELIGGRQPNLVLEGDPGANKTELTPEIGNWSPARRSRPLTPRLTEAENEAHQAFIASLGDAAIWRRYA